MKSVPNRVIVILDEAYFEYSQHIKDYPDSMLYRYDYVITLRTFSKAHGLAGFRVGYGFAHQELISNLMKVKLPFEPSSVSQEAAIVALDDSKHLYETLKLNSQEMSSLILELNHMKINFIRLQIFFLKSVYFLPHYNLNMDELFLLHCLNIEDKFVVL